MSFWYWLVSWLPFEWAAPDTMLFMKNALLAVLVVTPLFGLLSTMVVESRMAFFSDALGHSAFTGMAIGALCGLAEPVGAAVVFAVVIALLFTLIRQKTHMASDTAISVFSSAAVALGIFLSTLGGQSFTKFNNLLIGDILSVAPGEIGLLALILLGVVILWVTSFNQMMDHVKQMKIAAYEKELQYRYAQLQYLQLQISPHFFLNILKSLYGMAQGRNYEKIQTAILMISDHVRYIFHDNQDMVPLQTELHHVENYIQMQRYITSQSIAFHMEVEPGLEEAQVPALCLQTFVENSCKYATVPGRGLEISLEVRQLPSEEGGRLDAVIEAARIDGAGELRILIRVVLPMFIPIIATLALLVGLAYWNDWLNGLYYISDDRLFSIQVLLNRMLLDVQFLMSNSDAAKSLQQNEEFVLPSTGIRMAVAVMGALPILVVYPFFQKYFVKGIVIGAVKG